jgi:hypothetical protein
MIDALPGADMRVRGGRRRPAPDVPSHTFNFVNFRETAQPR